MPNNGAHWQDDDYFQLATEWQQALDAGNTPRLEQITQRLAAIERDRWMALTSVLPELTPYQSIAEAVEETAQQAGIPFPDLTQPPHHTDHLGRRRFAVCNGRREARI